MTLDEYDALHGKVATEKADRRVVMETKFATELERELEAALLIALPYVEDALDDQRFKKGVVKKHVKLILDALAKAAQRATVQEGSDVQS
jgi:hypothetical protein